MVMMCACRYSGVSPIVDVDWSAATLCTEIGKHTEITNLMFLSTMVSKREVCRRPYLVHPQRRLFLSEVAWSQINGSHATPHFVS